MKTLYCWLLRSYPAPFYRRFAHDMVADFNDGYSAACRGDSWTRFGFLARSYSDVIASALAEWSSTEIFIIWRTAVLAALSIWAIVFVIAALEWPAGPATLWFVLQLSVALATCAAITIGMALQRVRRLRPGE
jgi:hypothetical protein